MLLLADLSENMIIEEARFNIRFILYLTSCISYILTIAEKYFLSLRERQTPTNYVIPYYQIFTQIEFTRVEFKGND